MLAVERYLSPLSSLLLPVFKQAFMQSGEMDTEMEKTIVTRTFSIGAKCSGNRADPSDDFSTARRHSSAGIRALLWATSSAKSFGCSLGSDTQSSRENIFPNILTPDSIPQFTIPSLSVQNSLRSLENNKETNEPEEGLGCSESEQQSSVCLSQARSVISSSTSCSGLSLVVSDRKAERSVSDPLARRRSHLQKGVSLHCTYPDVQHCLDPASRAALSLPHLPKVTTPYGFITLSQSPQMANEEVLLCQAGLRRLNKDKETSQMTRTGVNIDSCRLSEAQKGLSNDPANSNTSGGLAKKDFPASCSFSSTDSFSSSSTARHPDGKLKRRIYKVLKKHFPSRH